VITTFKTITLPEHLIRLYAEFVEGDIKSSRDKYNQLIRTCTIDDLITIIDTTPFEQHAIQLYDIIVGKVKIPSEVVEKVNKYRIYIDELNKRFENII